MQLRNSPHALALLFNQLTHQELFPYEYLLLKLAHLSDRIASEQSTESGISKSYQMVPNMPVIVNGQTYYRTAEACRIASISKNTFFRWIREGLETLY